MILVCVYCSLSFRLIKRNLFNMLAGVEAPFHSFITTTIDGCECSSPRNGLSASGAFWMRDWASSEMSRRNSTLYWVYTKHCRVSVIC